MITESHASSLHVSPRSRIAVCLVAAVFAAAAALIIFRMAQPASGNPDPWPAFSMRYRVLTPEQPDAAVASYQVWQLEYTSNRSWMQTLVSDTAIPGRVGSTESFDGRVYRQYMALSRTTNEILAEGGVLTAPNRWLVPKSVKDHVSRGYAQTGSSAGAPITLVKHETMTCPADEEASGAAARCPRGASVPSDTAIDVTPDGISLRVVDTVNGVAVEFFASEQYAIH